MRNPQSNPMKAKKDIRTKYLPGTRTFLEARRPAADGPVVYALFVAHDLAMYLGTNIGNAKWCLMACNREGLVTRGRRPKSRSQFDTIKTQYAVPAHGKTIRDIPISQVDYMR
jgi:hypothetical protein